MIDGQAIVEEARKWIGTPFVHQGRTRFGVDCIGLVICVRHAVEPMPELLQEVTNYARRPKDGLLLERIANYCEPISQPEAGSVAIIQWHRKQPPSHVVILTGEGTMIHSYRNVERVCEVGYRSRWVQLTHAIFRLPGVK